MFRLFEKSVEIPCVAGVGVAGMMYGWVAYPGIQRYFWNLMKHSALKLDIYHLQIRRRYGRNLRRSKTSIEK